MIFEETEDQLKIGMVANEETVASRTWTDSTILYKSSNLADLPNASTSRTSIGLGSTAVGYNNLVSSALVSSSTMPPSLSAVQDASNVLVPATYFSSNTAYAASNSAITACNAANLLLQPTHGITLDHPIMDLLYNCM